MEIGRWEWWARSRATSAFYSSANEFDEYRMDPQRLP